MALVVADSIVELIGSTPIKRLTRISPPGHAEVWAKLECFNPGGSLKDRTALGMIEAAENDGRIRPGESTLIEPTAGNTGIGLALVGRGRGYSVVAVMPSNCSREKQIVMEALGARVVRTPEADGIQGAIRKAEELRESLPGGIILQQFSNPANPEIHYRTTAPEIWEQTGGKLAAIVVGAGTGGTFTGIARFMKERAPDVQRILVESQGSVLGGGKAGKHFIEGIGNSFIPSTCELPLATRIIAVTDREALATLKDVVRDEGLLVGGSSGAVAHAALAVARELPAGERVVCVFADPAERYTSKDLLVREDG